MIFAEGHISINPDCGNKKKVIINRVFNSKNTVDSSCDNRMPKRKPEEQLGG